MGNKEWVQLPQAALQEIVWNNDRCSRIVSKQRQAGRAVCQLRGAGSWAPEHADRNYGHKKCILMLCAHMHTHGHASAKLNNSAQERNTLTKVLLLLFSNTAGKAFLVQQKLLEKLSTTLLMGAVTRLKLSQETSPKRSSPSRDTQAFRRLNLTNPPVEVCWLLNTVTMSPTNLGATFYNPWFQIGKVTKQANNAQLQLKYSPSQCPNTSETLQVATCILNHRDAINCPPRKQVSQDF